MKKCSKCKKELGLENFYKDTTRKSGVYSRCKKCLREYNKKYYLVKHDEILKTQRKYNRIHRDQRKKYLNLPEVILRRKKYNINHKNDRIIYRFLHKKEELLRRQEIKKECFNAYGGCFCSCCGVEDLIFLTLDHVNNDGNIDRKTNRKAGTNLYIFLRKHQYPDKKRYQVLCMNCQFSKQYNNGICPHRKDIDLGVSVYQKKFEIWNREQINKEKYLETYQKK